MDEAVFEAAVDAVCELIYCTSSRGEADPKMLPLVQLVVPAVSAEDWQYTKQRSAVQHNILRQMITPKCQLGHQAVVYMLLSLGLQQLMQLMLLSCTAYNLLILMLLMADVSAAGYGPAAPISGCPQAGRGGRPGAPHRCTPGE